MLQRYNVTLIRTVSMYVRPRNCIKVLIMDRHDWIPYDIFGFDRKGFLSFGVGAIFLREDQ